MRCSKLKQVECAMQQGEIPAWRDDVDAVWLHGHTIFDLGDGHRGESS